ncbi:uncharacterized protein LOC123296873 isoform X1 [Chrysoperla carnea]|uniref:uncharacterized protein LOC123296873 isoform X1 n=1 Tax=Chrysoperla carnea TaxID=189513 RepID=UPI001D089885|nr:uncharacterized protein LOC123296873 isoform X1 [Chrysoperla carnea]
MATIDLETEDKLEYNFYPVTSGSLTFKIRAPHDAHVALTSGPAESDPMYEIFIGGWNNTKSVIRKNRTKPDVAEAETPDVLNGEEFRGFWIRWSGGTIEAGHEGDSSPFLSYTDPEPAAIGYFGLCTGWGASGTWKVDGRDDLETPDALEYKYHPVLAGGLDIQIRSPHNCHVALTSDKQETDPMYELILGGWENTASAIRYRREKPDKVHVSTPHLLHAQEPRRLLIEWNNGHITARVTSRQHPIFLEWHDPNPIGISYFGVRTAWGATGKWRVKSYDPRDGLSGSAQPSAPSAPAPSGGGSGAVCWVPAKSGEVPPTAVQGGQDNGEPLYVARAPHEGALIPGKLVASHGVAYVAWGGAEHGKEEYEVLCDCACSWVPASGGQVPEGAVPGGQTEDGEPLFVGRVEHNGSLTVGKVQSSHSVLYIPYGGEELGFSDYEVLVVQ